MDLVRDLPLQIDHLGQPSLFDLGRNIVGHGPGSQGIGTFGIGKGEDPAYMAMRWISNWFLFFVTVCDQTSWSGPQDVVPSCGEVVPIFAETPVEVHVPHRLTCLVAYADPTLRRTV